MQSPPRILVIDDNPSNLKILRVLLTSEGYQIVTAPDAEIAIDLIAETPPHLIVTDIQLPGMDGYTLVRRLKSDPKTRHIPIIAVTAYAMMGDEEKALEAGCDAYMTKPVDIHKLPLLVKQLLKL